MLAKQILIPIALGWMPEERLPKEKRGLQVEMIKYVAARLAREMHFS